MTPQQGDLVEVVDMMSALMLDCWPFGLVWEAPTLDGRVLVAMLGDHVRRSENGAGCRVWLVGDLRIVYRPAPAPGKEKP